MKPHRTLLLVLSIYSACGSASADGILHFTLGRRGGRLATHASVDLEKIAESVRQTEERYSRTFREYKNNRLVRIRRTTTSGTTEDHELVTEPGQPGHWFFNLGVGDPVQAIEVDLDMLSPDFYTLMTTSESGSRYNVFSRSHVPSEVRVHPLCKLPTENVHIGDPNKHSSISLLLPMCSPSKNSRLTTGPSGSVLGLAPSDILTRISAPNLLQQLLAKEAINFDLFSLTLSDLQTGNLSLGGTIAEQIEESKTRFHVRLDNIGNVLATQEFIDAEVHNRMSQSFPTTTKDQFRWVDVHGARGWWTALMGGVWINGAKTVQNQPVVFDIQSPFILAPPAAAQAFYESIHAAKRLPKPHDNMFKFPCLNQPNIAFEFDRWLFPTLSGDVNMEERFDGPLGGKLSLGKLREGSGYCLGVVIESRMGLSNADVQSARMDGRWRSSGLDDLWVIGEPFFRGTGLAFDIGKQKIGFRTY